MNKQIKSFVDIGFSKGMEEDSEKGILYIKGIASSMVDSNGNEYKDLDSELVDITNAQALTLANGKLSLQTNHDLSTDASVGVVTDLKIVGKQLHFEAEVHKALNERIYAGVKAGVFTAVSIGFVIDDYEVIEYAGDKSVGKLNNPKIFEVSIVSVPANQNAVFTVTAEKGFTIEQSTETLKHFNEGCTGLCPIKSSEKPKGKIKDLTQDKVIDKEIKKSIYEKLIEKTTKALTIEETEKASWNKYRELMHQFNMLGEVLEDNFYAGEYEDIDKDIMLSNIRGAFETVMTRVESLMVDMSEEDLKQHHYDEDEEKPVTKEMEKKEMVTKDGTEAVAEQPTETKQEIAETTTTEESTPSQSQEAEEATDSGSVESKQETVVDEKTEAKEEPKQEVAEEPKVEQAPVKAEVTLGTVIDTYNNLDLSSLSREEVVTLYETIDLQRQKLENTDVFIQLVEERVQAKLQENN